MIYVPMIKTRQEELKVFNEMSYCFSKNMMPLIEIINEIYEIRYKKDEHGEYVYNYSKKRKTKIKEEPTEEDIITLKEINKIVDGKMMFIDYFRFSLKKYGKNIDIKKAGLSFDLNSNLDLYKKKLLETIQYSNMIPVVSIKNDCEFPKSNLIKFVLDLQEKTTHMALRITADWLDETKDIIGKLRASDFLLFDVEEQNPQYKFVEIEELNELKAECQIILLNSPRKKDIKNGEYPEHDETDLINNCAREVALEYNLSGYGDYCGLKDVMPSNDGSNGKGAALALLYDYNKNVFYSYCNHDTSKGMSGYTTLIPVIRSDENALNPDRDCPAYEKINSMSTAGNWATWHHINAARYIHQTYKYM